MRPSERLTVVATLALAALTAAVRPEGMALRLAIFLTMAAATVLLARRARSGMAKFVRDWWPVGEVILFFLLLQPIIEATVPWRLDAALAAFDASYLAALAEAWAGAFGRPAAFTDAVYVAYFSYYLLPITVAALGWRRSPTEFEQTVFAVLLGFYLTFLGYLLLPASGPRLPIAEEARVLGGGAISEAVRGFLRVAETTTLDAFPSGHTTIAVVSGAMASRLLPPSGAAMIWAWAGAIVFATVYINVHYVADVIAGLALALLVLALCPARRRPASQRTRTGPAPTSTSATRTEEH